ncbi:MAG: transcription antitermination factor NusB [Bacteroidaceae bacterium]|jgi:N utilization substance protein B
MINRILIRTKIIQIAYVFYQNENKTIESSVKELMFSLNKAYDLYNELLALPIEITRYAQKRIEAGLAKYCPTEEEMSPNRKFIENLFIKQLASCKELRENLERISNDNAEEGKRNYIKSLGERIMQGEIYQEYMSTPGNDYEEDRNLWKKLYKVYICNNEELEQLFEEESLYWNYDKDIIDTFVLKTIRKFNPEQGSNQPLLPKYTTPNDEDFAITLFRKALENEKEWQSIIKQALRNWEVERIALIDQIILQVAIAEIVNFPEIPLNVSLNEYIEIAKQYSTPNSASFINGTLAGIVNQLKKEGKLIGK